MSVLTDDNRFMSFWQDVFNVESLQSIYNDASAKIMLKYPPSKLSHQFWYTRALHTNS